MQRASNCLPLSAFVEISTSCSAESRILEAHRQIVSKAKYKPSSKSNVLSLWTTLQSSFSCSTRKRILGDRESCVGAEISNKGNFFGASKVQSTQ